MQRQDFIEKIIKTTMDKILEINKTKGEEYSGANDVCKNFKRQAEMLDIDPKLVWAVYVNKHWDAIMSHVKNGIVFSEPIEGRIYDTILYLLLYRALIKDQDTVFFSSDAGTCDEKKVNIIPTFRFLNRPKMSGE